MNLKTNQRIDNLTKSKEEYQVRVNELAPKNEKLYADLLESEKEGKELK